MKNKLEQFIQNNAGDLDKKKPNPDVLNKVLLQMQEKAKTKPRTGIIVSFTFIKWAAVACLAGIVAGITIWQLQKQPQPVVVVKTKTVAPAPVQITEPDTIKPAGIDVVDQDLAKRKLVLTDQIKDKKPVVFAGFNNIESAAGRITMITKASALKNINNDVVDALLNVLNNDANSNVRLAALDGLTHFYRDNYTKKKLLASLKKQKDPIVQITLIDLLTRMRESGILTELEKIVHDDNTEKAVKDCAYSGILQFHS